MLMISFSVFSGLLLLVVIAGIIANIPQNRSEREILKKINRGGKQ